MSSKAAISIRVAEAGDRSAIGTLHRAAFPADFEARLVEALERNGDVVLSLVAVSGGAIVGHALHSRLLLDGMDAGATALAPVAVLPERQKEGIGTALIREAHHRLRHLGERTVLVLGDPAFYRRFGFSAAGAAPFRTPYDGPYLSALVLDDNSRAGGRVTYPPAFADRA
jgi:putative acetyltransferase